MKKILLLEEDAIYAAELRRGLVRFGLDVLLLRDGNEGLARAVSERFDAILVSAELPSVNGFRICNRVKKDPNVRDVPVFVVGGREEDRTAHQSLATRADDYFAKPAELSELLASLRRHGLVEGASEAADLNQARAGLAAVGALRDKVREQEAVITTLNAELARARANATRGEARDDERILALARRERDAERASNQALRARLAEAEAEAEAHKARARDDGRVLAEKKAELAALRADKDRPRDTAEASLASINAAQSQRIAALERELAEAYERSVALEVKQREVARALSDLARRTASLGEERARLAQRSTKAEQDLARAESELLAFKKVAAERQRIAREDAERRQREAIATAVAAAEARLRESARELGVVRESSTRAARALSAERDQRKAAEERLAAAEAWFDQRLIEDSRQQDKALTNAVAAAERRVREELEQAKAAASTRPVEDLSVRLADERTIDALEALAASRAEDIVALEQEADEAKAEIPALEAEIVVLRSELFSLRRQLDGEIVAGRAAAAELDRHGDVLRRAESVLEGLAEDDSD